MRFVGRQVELTLLLDESRRVLRDGGRVVVIEGTAGIGKTRLMAEVASRLTRFRCVRVSGIDAPGAPSLWTWYHALSSLDAAGSLPAPEADGPDFRLRRAYGDAIAAAGRAHPLLVLIDDVHRADSASVALLQHLAAVPPQAPVLVLAAYRDDEGRETPVASPAASVVLGGLAPAEVGDLAADLAGRPLATAVLNQLYRRTDGNPALIGQVVTQFAAAEANLAELGRLPVAWPEPVLVVIRRRLERLAKATVEALAAAAVVGREFDLSVLEQMLSEPAGSGGRDSAPAGSGDRASVSNVDLVDALDEAVRGRVIAHRPGEVYRFIHSIDRELLYDSLGLRERARLHDAAAEALLAAATPGTDRAPTVAELAYHLMNAAVFGGADRLDKAIGHAVTAAVVASEHGRADIAVAYHTAALGLAIRADWPPAPRGRLMVAAGVAQAANGDAKAGRAALAAAARLARAHADGELLAEAALGHGPPVGAGVTAVAAEPEVVAMMTEALSDETVTASLRSRLHARLAASSSSTVDLAAQHSAQALRAAQECGDPRAVADAFLAAAVVDPAADVLPALRTARALGDPVLECRARLATAQSRLGLGDVTTAGRELEAVARLSGDPYVRWHAALATAHHSLLAGDADRALRLAEEARTRGEPISAGGAALAHTVQCAAVRLAQGCPAELAPVLSGLTWTAPQPGWFTALAAVVAAADGETPVAAELLAEVLDLAATPAVHPQDALWTVTLAAEVALALDDAAAVRSLLARLTPHAGQWVVLGPAVASAGPVALVVSRLHLALSDLASAQMAIDRVTGTALVWAPHVRLQRARILAAATRPRTRASGDLDPAVREARAALAGATERALMGIARQAQVLLQHLAGPAGTGLTRREREVADLALRGLSAKEIAARLYLGERTVETHLASIYRKLDVRSRVELMARFADAPLPGN